MTYGGLITRVVCKWNGVGRLVVAALLPVLAFEGREERNIGCLPCLKEYCIINDLKLSKTILLLKKCKGIPIFRS
jgi:hypothetical protein